MPLCPSCTQHLARYDEEDGTRVCGPCYLDRHGTLPLPLPRLLVPKLEVA